MDRSALILDMFSLIECGPDAAPEAGERLLTGLTLKLWRRALTEGPATALPVTLSELRIDDRTEPEPANSIIWCSASALASAPRPFVRLIGLNSGRWPRQIAEDRLIPDHVIPLDELDPLPVAEADRRDFATIRAMTAHSIALSYSRRDAEGRLLGKSPLISGSDETYLARGRIPEHATSEADRLLARPGEFAGSEIGRSGLGCWRDWYRPALTPHDGLLGAGHPRILKPWPARNRPARCACCCATRSALCGNTRSAGASPMRPRAGDARCAGLREPRARGAARGGRHARTGWWICRRRNVAHRSRCRWRADRGDAPLGGRSAGAAACHLE